MKKLKTYVVSYKRKTPTGRKESWLKWVEATNQKEARSEFKADYPEAVNIALKRKI